MTPHHISPLVSNHLEGKNWEYNYKLKIVPRLNLTKTDATVLISIIKLIIKYKGFTKCFFYGVGNNIAYFASDIGSAFLIFKSVVVCLPCDCNSGRWSVVFPTWGSSGDTVGTVN